MWDCHEQERKGANMSAVLQQSTDESLDRWEKYRAAVGGLSEYWYPVMTVAELRRKKRAAIELLGRKLVLFYDQGRCRALLDECAHRRVPLSLGRIEFPGHITCIYHGLTYNLESGQMVAALTDGPNSPIARKLCVRTFPVEERIGLVFIWAGEGKPVPVEDDIPTELLEPDARIYPYLRRVDGNWRHAAENGFDEAHLKMVHRYALWVTFRNVSAWNETEIEKSDDGVWLTRVQKNVHLFDEYPGLGSWPKKHFWKPSPKTGTRIGGKDHLVAVRLPGILRVRQPGKAGWIHYEWYVPINKNRYIYLMVAVPSRRSLWKRFMFWLRYWGYIRWIHHHLFNNQDLGVVARTPESTPRTLFRPDISTIEWRRLVEQNTRPVNRDASSPIMASSGLHS
jgi:phenylpropionate dioxygenase-like ring-hydroxylating dioxygenase large terminal subunit